jgi:hypothetical protein
VLSDCPLAGIRRGGPVGPGLPEQRVQLCYRQAGQLAEPPGKNGLAGTAAAKDYYAPQWNISSITRNPARAVLTIRVTLTSGSPDRA